MCLGLWHCEHSVCVFLVMLCSAKAEWHHQALERAVGGTGSMEGLGDFVPIRASNLGLNQFLLMVWMAEGGAIGKLSIKFRSLFVQGLAPPKLIK